jgi:hypothetical protein
VADAVTLPAGTTLQWSGQYESLARAEARLAIVVPLTLLLVFLLLYLNFRRLTETLIVMLSLPFALVGGVWLLWWMGFNLSVAVAVGFIALAGVAAETGVIMLVYLDHALDAARAACDLRGSAGGHHGRRGRAGAAQDDDGRGHHGGAAADPLEPGGRLGGHAAHRGSDDRRDGLLDPPDPDRHPGGLRPGEGLGPAGDRRGHPAGGAVPPAAERRHSRRMMARPFLRAQGSDPAGATSADMALPRVTALRR